MSGDFLLAGYALAFVFGVVVTIWRRWRGLD